MATDSLRITTDSVSTADAQSVGRPRRVGRPREVEFSDLFLWDPWTQPELYGIGISKIFDGLSPECLALVYDMRRKRPIGPERIAEILPTVVEQMPERVGEAMTSLFRAYRAGASYGAWEVFIYASAWESGSAWPPSISPLGKHLVGLEKALVAATNAADHGDYATAAMLVENSPELKPYLWKRGIEVLAKAESSGAAWPARMAVALEIRLSILAYTDANLAARLRREGTMFHVLFPERGKHPNRKLFEWLATYSGVGSALAQELPQLSNRAADHDLESSKRRIRKWKRGAGFPSNETWNAWFRNLYGSAVHMDKDPNHERWVVSGEMADACRQLSFMLPLCQRLQRESGLPFGAADMERWLEARYPYWFEHWASVLRPGSQALSS
jgi:hypothetical protein